VRAHLPHLPLLAVVAAAAVAIAVYAGAAAASSPGTTGELGVDQAFVIGNGNASVGAAVNFWGAQWWKNNSLHIADAPADLSAPSAFKGFAVSLDPTAPLCGPFTTSTGNSSNPPAGPLPATMTVLIANSVVQSGSTITGNIVGWATVSTDPGYDGDPGHPGTGTVLSVNPCGGPF
jgi:hypothetical protein